MKHPVLETEYVCECFRIKFFHPLTTSFQEQTIAM